MPAKRLFFLLICTIAIGSVKADGLSDFSNNLASDLGPLLSLVGDPIIRQYLSESTSFIDYFILAMAPIGIIGIITAAIRVCGYSWLRAFIGRAQEGQGAVEAELCTSTSADVCELFNKGGITRVLGRPDIIELIYEANKGRDTQNQPRLYLFTSYLSEKSNATCWPRLESSERGNAFFNKIGHSNSEFPELAPKPNLSLNVGIKRQPDWVFYLVALIGFILQGGILVFAAISVWLLKWNIQKSTTEASQNYAPGMFIAGTVVLCFGVWSCAALIGQTTNEQYYQRSPETSDILYWVQPGPQIIDFDKNFEVATLIAVLLVLFGYIAQFIGLRGLNAWISIAQLIITLLMSASRGLLRMKRLGKNDNHLDKLHDLAAGHELDWLAFDIAKRELHELQLDASSARPGQQMIEKRLRCDNLFENRIRLSNLTGHSDGFIDAKSYLSWKDERVKVRAKAKSNKNDIHLKVKAVLSHDVIKYVESVVFIKMKPPTGPDHINWSLDSSQLEATLGLLLWSMVSSEHDTSNKYGINRDSSNRSNETKIFRVVSACLGEQNWDDSFDADMSLWLGSGDLKYLKQSLDVSEYGNYKYSIADDWAIPKEGSPASDQGTNERSRIDESFDDSASGIQKFCVNVKGYYVKNTEHSLLESCAQDLFAALMRSMKALGFRKIDKISVSESGGNIRLENPVVSALAKCFTDNGLGTHSDAVSCLIPSLKSHIPPYQEKVFSALTLAAARYRRDEEWNSAEVVLRWACKYYHTLNPVDADETSYFMLALRELGELYRWSLSRRQDTARQQFGKEGIKWIATEFGGDNPVVTLYVSAIERKGDKIINSPPWIDEFYQAVVESRRTDALYYLGFAGNVIPRNLGSKCLPLAARNGWEEIISALLEMKADPNTSKDNGGRTAQSHCAELGLRQSLRRFIDTNADFNLADGIEMTPLAYAAKNGQEDAVRALIETGRIDLNGPDDFGEKSPLWLATDHSYLNIIAELLGKGADANIKDYRGCGLLDLAIRRGNLSAVKLLLERGLTIEREPPESDGFFSTLEFRPLSPVIAADTKHVKFDPPYSEPPRLMIGISGLRIELDSTINMRWEASSVSETEFTLMRRKYEDSNVPVDSVDVVWIESGAEEREFQVYDFKKCITFQNAFKSKPDVAIWLSGFWRPHPDIRVDGQQSQLDISPRMPNATTEGFVLSSYFDADRKSEAYITWLAYPHDSTHIQSGVFARYNPLSHKGLMRQEFDGRFERTPRVFLALRGISFHNAKKKINSWCEYPSSRLKKFHLEFRQRNT
ncbi:hypothetical protein V8C35DRAFT_328441 [Trichoderma chlorosporum]